MREKNCLHPKRLGLRYAKTAFYLISFFFVLCFLHFNDLWLSWLLFILVWKPTYCVTEMCADKNINLLPIRNLLNHIVCACVKSNLYYFSSHSAKIDQLCENRMIWATSWHSTRRVKRALAANEAAAHAITGVELVGGSASIIKTSLCLYLTELCDNEMKIDTDIRRRSLHWINSFQRSYEARGNLRLDKWNSWVSAFRYHNYRVGVGGEESRAKLEKHWESP